MNKTNMMQWVDDAIAAKEKTGMLVLSFPAIQKMGITVRQLVQDSDLQAQAMKVVADTIKLSASVSMMDLSVEAEAFGCEVQFTEEEVPNIVSTVAESEEEAEALAVPEVGAGRTQLYIDASVKATQMIQDRPVFGGVIGPFSLAGRLMGVSEALINCYEEPDMVHILLEKSTEFQIKYIQKYKDAGVNGVVLAEPLAGLLSPALEEEFSTPYVKKIVDAVQSDDFLIIYHNCGTSPLQCMESIAANGCRAFHFGNASDMEKILEKAPKDVLIMGNVDPSSQFRNGTPESVKARTLELMESCSKYPNYIPSSGCDIPPMTPWENIMAFREAIDEYYGK